MAVIDWFGLPRSRRGRLIYTIALMIVKMQIYIPYVAVEVGLDDFVHAFLVIYASRCAEAFLTQRNVAQMLSQEVYLPFFVAFAICYATDFRSSAYAGFFMLAFPFLNAISALQGFKHYRIIIGAEGRFAYLFAQLAVPLLYKCSAYGFFQALFNMLADKFLGFTAAEYGVLVYSLLDGAFVASTGDYLVWHCYWFVERVIGRFATRW